MTYQTERPRGGNPGAGTERHQRRSTAEAGSIVRRSQSNVDGPYARSAEVYLAAGWFPIPVDVGDAGKVIPGTTGNNPVPPASQVLGWIKTHGRCNVGLWLPDDVIGIDVDHYDEHRGQDTIDWLSANVVHEPLPPTYSVTARGPVQSARIYLYRVQGGQSWLSDLSVGKKHDPDRLGDVQIIQQTHRFVRTAPSVKPDKSAAGTVYQMYAPDTRTVCGVPTKAHLTWLPEPWQKTLRRSGGTVTREGTARALALTDEDVDAFAYALPLGPPCLAVRGVLKEWQERLLSSRHDNMVGGIWALLREGARGHAGALDAIVELGESFKDAVAGDRSDVQAEAEWFRALKNGVRRVAGETAGRVGKGCNCAAYEAWVARIEGER